MSQFFDTVWNDFLSVKKDFNRYIIIGVLCVFITHFYVIESYFFYKNQQKKAVKELKEKKVQLEKLLKQLEYLETTYKKVHKPFQNIQEKIRAFPQHLRSVLPKIRRSFSANFPSQPRDQTWQQSDYRVEPLLSFPSNVKTFEEAVRWYINRWFKEIINGLQNKVVNPVWELEEDLRLGDQTKLAYLCQDALKKIRNYIDNIDPNFWHSYERGKVSMASGLYHVVEESFKPIYKEIDRLIKDLNNVVCLKKEELQGTQNAFERLQKQEKKLETRLEFLESPIGKIPISLTDFVKVFPFLIVILMLMITTYLSKSRRLYTVIWREIEKNSGKIEKMIFQNHIKPWFLPPYQNPVPLILLNIVLLTLLSIFFRSIFLIIKEPDLFISIIGRSETFIKTIFIGAYAFSIFIMFVCIWIIQKQLRT